MGLAQHFDHGHQDSVQQGKAFDVLAMLHGLVLVKEAGEGQTE